MARIIEADSIRLAARAIQGQVIRTPSVASGWVSEYLGAAAVLKLENLQIAGSFKPRGIINKLASLSKQDLSAGVVTVSGGNHAIALAHIAEPRGIKAIIVMPRTVPEQAKKRVVDSGAELVLTENVQQAFEVAQTRSQEQGLTYIHSYADDLIIAGHGTVGAELMEDHPDLTDIVVSIGGGGLISGVATAVKDAKPTARIWGVETRGASAMSQALKVGRPLATSVTSIATTLGAPIVSEGTLAHVQSLVEEVFVVSDRDAVDGMRVLAENGHVWGEPAAGCTIAAAKMAIRKYGADIRLGLVICGGNAQADDFVRWKSQLLDVPPPDHA
jgi:threonine dehydratase